MFLQRFEHRSSMALLNPLPFELGLEELATRARHGHKLGLCCAQVMPMLGTSYAHVGHKLHSYSAHSCIELPFVEFVNVASHVKAKETTKTSRKPPPKDPL